MKKFSLWVLIGFLLACSPDSDELPNENIERDDRKLQEYFSLNSVSPNQTSLGIFYEKLESNDLGNQISNGDILGIYYEIRTLEGRVIDSYLDESRPPRIYIHEDGGTIPRAINFASPFAKEGETLLVYAPSYLGYKDYSFQQLIQPDENLRIQIKFSKIFNELEIIEMEENSINDHIQSNNLQGFEQSDSGLFIRKINEGDGTSPKGEEGKLVLITYSISHLNETQPVAQVTSPANAFQITLGSDQNLPFLEEAFSGLSKGAEISVIAPSHLAFGATTQVFPFSIRRDLVEKGRLNQSVRPFEPIIFNAKVVEVR